MSLVDFIKHFEGLHRLGKNGLVYPYRCPAGVLTVGYGTTRFDKSKESFTVQECQDMLEVEIRIIQGQLFKLSPALRNETESRQTAIISWVYNLGITAYRGSTMKRYIDLGDWEHASVECRKWVWGGGRRLPGLILRRNAEAALMLQ